MTNNRRKSSEEGKLLFTEDETNKLNVLFSDSKQMTFLSDRDNLEISGFLMESPQNLGNIIFCHGRGGNKGEFLYHRLELAYSLFIEGFNLLFFDFRGHGNSKPSVYSFGYFERLDILGAIKFLTENRLGSGDNNGILGFSMGAEAAMLAAVETKYFKALVSESGYSSMENVLEIPYTSGKVLLRGSAEHKQAVTDYKKEMGWDFNISAIDGIDRISPCALFLIDGEAEKEDNLLLYQKAKEPKDIWMVDGACHGNVTNIAKEQYNKKVLQFFLKYLTKR